MAGRRASGSRPWWVSARHTSAKVLLWCGDDWLLTCDSQPSSDEMSLFVVVRWRRPTCAIQTPLAIVAPCGSESPRYLAVSIVDHSPMPSPGGVCGEVGEDWLGAAGLRARARARLRLALWERR